MSSRWGFPHSGQLSIVSPSHVFVVQNILTQYFDSEVSQSSREYRVSNAPEKRFDTVLDGGSPLDGVFPNCFGVHLITSRFNWAVIMGAGASVSTAMNTTMMVKGAFFEIDENVPMFHNRAILVVNTFSGSFYIIIHLGDPLLFETLDYPPHSILVLYSPSPDIKMKIDLGDLHR